MDQVSDTVVELEIPSCLVGVWKKSGRSQLIAELELLPVLAAILHHKDLVATRRVLLFVDNNAARDCLIKAGSRSPTLFAMLSQVFQAVADLGSLLWVSRVPSKSNIADLPSRGQAEQAAGLIKGTVQSSPELSCELLQLLSSSISFASYLAADGKALKGKGGEIDGPGRSIVKELCVISPFKLPEALFLCFLEKAQISTTVFVGLIVLCNHIPYV